jgi:EAL domain-containing protein (putative c-di-GMP-specific phosphodiesterase class I)/GGDEF domain-containing protein
MKPMTATGTWQAERERLLAFSFVNADLLVELDHRLSITFASGAVRQFTGHADDQIIGKAFPMLLAPRDRAMVALALSQLQPNARMQPVATLIGTGQTPMPVQLTGYRLDGAGARYFLTASQRAAQPGEMEIAARTDRATGLLAADDFADAAIKASESGKAVKMTMVELDGFDGFSQRVGAANVEKMLGDMGAMLRSLSLEGQAAGRLAADQFGVVHDAKTDPVMIRANVAAICKVADPTGAGLAVKGNSMALDGAALKPEEMSRVLRFAIRFFADKGLAQFHPDSLNEPVRELVNDTVRRVVEVRSTLSSAQIEVAYQKIVGLADCKVHHWEALCRPLGNASPGAMIGFAEQVGLAGEFDLLVAGKVVDALREAAARGLKPEVAINLSAASVGSDVFLAALEQVFAPHGDVRPQILIEITESTELRDLAAADRIIQDFRRKGHKVCLDDFGAGSAAFPYIQALTVDHVKIDGVYIRRMLEGKRDAAIVRSIVHLCAELQMGTIAEMIETEAQATKLRDLGIDCGQGYLFGKPAIEEDFSASKAAPQLESAAQRERRELGLTRPDSGRGVGIFYNLGGVLLFHSGIVPAFPMISATFTLNRHGSLLECRAVWFWRR